MSRMKGVFVDPTDRTARVQPGCILGDVDRETQLHGLATPFGFVSETGVAGLTLGGGFGYLTRRFGWSVDNLLEVEIVTADGRVLRASSEEHPELFWALRGGGGNFGVVTEFTFRAHSVADVVGGPTFWPLEQTDEVLAAYREFLPELARNATGFFCSHPVPPAPPFPEEIHMRKICGIVWCIVGSDEEAEQAMAPMLAVAEPLMHGVQRMPLPALNSAFDGLYAPGDQWYWRADFLDEIPDEAGEPNVGGGDAMPTIKTPPPTYPLDRAPPDVRPHDTPRGHPHARLGQGIVGGRPG